jgi:putative nucleotidyltransferase with HDIG domain
MIDAMLKIGIMSVYIQEITDDEDDEPISPVAQKNIERLRTEDRAKVCLSASVRAQVAEGIQFVYSNTADPALAKTVTSIADTLLDAIRENNALAIDISALKTSDEYTFKHSVDVAMVSMIVAQKMGMSETDIYNIGVAGLLHDVGKTKIPLEILNKPGRLDDDEFEIMRQHSVYSYRIIQDNPDLPDAVKLAVLQHHEKINGTGYPLAATADQINPYAKVLTIADIYDALVTERPYKSAFSQREAVEMIMSMTQELDMHTMESFLQSMILYPVDSIVELSNGERARVVKNSPYYILRPTVVGLTSGRVYDLGDDLGCASIIIL